MIWSFIPHHEDYDIAGMDIAVAINFMELERVYTKMGTARPKFAHSPVVEWAMFVEWCLDATTFDTPKLTPELELVPFIECVLFWNIVPDIRRYVNWIDRGFPVIPDPTPYSLKYQIDHTRSLKHDPYMKQIEDVCRALLVYWDRWALARARAGLSI